MSQKKKYTFHLCTRREIIKIKNSTRVAYIHYNTTMKKINKISDRNAYRQREQRNFEMKIKKKSLYVQKKSPTHERRLAAGFFF